MSRTKAKNELSLDQYKEEMEGSDENGWASVEELLADISKTQYARQAEKVVLKN